MTNELAQARAIIAGELPSPWQVDRDLWLIALRITGTGHALRPGLDEHAFRDPAFYMNQDFCDRCAGLPVIVQHPPAMSLDASEYARRAIGSIMLAYLKPDAGEVWGIARLNVDGEMIEAIGEASTSPSIVMRPGTEVELQDGSTLNVEGEPLILDHVAIVDEGVWDKGGAAGRGVDDSQETNMAEKDEKTEQTEGKDGDLAKVLDAIGGIGKRLDRMDKRMDALEHRGDDADGDDDGEDEDGEGDGKSRRPSPKRAIADRRQRGDAAEEEDALAAAQQRADDVAMSWGKRAPRPLDGEPSRLYRRRQMVRWQEYSPDYKSVDLSTITDPELFNTAERVIYADATRAASDNARVPPLMLREVHKVDQAGRKIIEFVGDVRATLLPFRLPSMLVKGGKFHTHPEPFWG